MRGIFVHLLPWLIVLAIGWMAGDRYGAPGWMRGLSDGGFSAVENAAGGVFGNLFDRDDEAEPASDDADNSDEAMPGAGEAVASGIDEGDSATAAAGGIPENSGLHTNDAGLTIIKYSEGLRLEPYAADGYSYIGYGHQIQEGESFAAITEAEAEALLNADIAFFENGVRQALTRPATENQFSAMVSLAYNIGLYGFADSDVLRKFNAGDIQGAANAFRNYTGRGGATPHLVERRERERMLFLK